VQNKSSKLNKTIKTKPKNLKELKQLLTKDFIYNLMGNVRLKIYDYSVSDKQFKRKQNFKKNFRKVFMSKVERREKEAKLDRDQKKRDFSYRSEASARGIHRDKKQEIPHEEIALIHDFLRSFRMSSDSGDKDDQIDIKRALKAVPSKVDESNVFMCDLFNFEATNNSLIAFQNDNQDMLFKYYDKRNKTRLNKLNLKATITKDQTLELKELGSTILSILNKIENVGKDNVKK
jgi:hypothetical protein